MKGIVFLLLTCLIFTPDGAIAGQSGYILNGKVVITHKDGVPVEATENKLKRDPASATNIKGTLYFDEDDLARCYWLPNQSSIYCVKK
jgi:hypothetical protein